MKQSGFTLMELVLACVIIGVLVTLALPTYNNYIQKVRRTDAKSSLLAASQQLERYYTQQNTYATATLGTGGVYAAVSPNSYYTLTLPSAFLTASTYRLVATPTGTQSSDACGTFTLDEQGNQGVVYGSITDAAQCW